MNQSDLLARIENRDPTVFKDLVNHWQAMVYNTALSIVQVAEDAEDITQEVFIEVFEKMGDFKGASQIQTWIYRITINKALDLEKKKKSEKHGGLLKRIFNPTPLDEPVNFNHPGVVLDNKEKAAVLFKSLSRLPEKQRIAFTLHKIEGLPQQEIAAIMETSVTAVESLMTRARAGLKNLLEAYYKQHS